MITDIQLEEGGRMPDGYGHTMEIHRVWAKRKPWPTVEQRKDWMTAALEELMAMEHETGSWEGVMLYLGVVETRVADTAARRPYPAAVVELVQVTRCHFCPKLFHRHNVLVSGVSDFPSCTFKVEEGNKRFTHNEPLSAHSRKYYRCDDCEVIYQRVNHPTPMDRLVQPYPQETVRRYYQCPPFPPIKPW